PSRARGRDLFSPADVAILRAVGSMRRAGLTEAAGFRVEDLAMYRDAMTALLSQEISLFAQNVVGSRRRKDETIRLARAAATGATDLLVALRRKLLTDLVSSSLVALEPEDPKEGYGRND